MPSPPPHESREASRSEAVEIEDRVLPAVSVVHEAIRRQGEEEVHRAPAALAWSGLASGLSIGFSLLTQALLMVNLPDSDWRELVVKLGYSVGFLIIILGRQQLFTENTLTPLIPVLRNRALLGRMLRLWAIVLLTNLIGAGLFAWALQVAPNFPPKVDAALLEIARAAFRGEMFPTFTGGIFAGWLIALMIWLLPFALRERVLVITLVTYVIALGHFDHCIAGSVEILYLVFSGEVSWSQYFVEFLLPALAGNVLGGVVLVTLVNHAQTFAGEES